MPATAARTEPSLFVLRSVEVSPVIAKLEVVAEVVVAWVKTPVLGVVAPIGVLSMVPPEIVRSFAISSSTQSNEIVPPSVSAVESTEPELEMVKASVMNTSLIVDVADTTPEMA